MLSQSFEEKVREYLEIDKRVYFLFLCLITFLALLIKKAYIENAIDLIQTTRCEQNYEKTATAAKEYAYSSFHIPVIIKKLIQIFGEDIE